MQDENRSRHDVDPNSAGERRPYRKPRLERFGTLTEITQNMGMMNMSAPDGSTMAMDKTS